ncbi:unnamed protein product [Clavelina lepadiformis]|uniref:Uncharacterized protein n=1 Tax=Clavelina lepadiformis TaxID=159417 RepID=A0ABP0GFA7_CLALP
MLETLIREFRVIEVTSGNFGRKFFLSAREGDKYQNNSTRGRVDDKQSADSGGRCDGTRDVQTKIDEDRIPGDVLGGGGEVNVSREILEYLLLLIVTSKSKFRLGSLEHDNFQEMRENEKLKD